MKRIWMSSIAMLVLPGAALAQLGGPLPVIGDRPPTELPHVPTTPEEVFATVEHLNPVDEEGCIVVVHRLQSGDRITFDSCDTTNEIEAVEDAEGVAHYRDGESHTVLFTVNDWVGSDGAKYRVVWTREIKPGGGLGGGDDCLPIVGGPAPSPGPVLCDVVSSIPQAN